MCGIVGLLVKKPEMQAALGQWMLPMLIGMTERGPDSAGLAVFGAPVADGAIKINLYSLAEQDWDAVKTALAAAHPAASAQWHIQSNHAVLTTTLPSTTVKSWINQHFPQVHVLSAGQLMDVYKDVGSPAQVAERYGFAQLQGTHLVGHTRMATESAITPAHAHPYTAGEDWCLVHNGSLSNANSLRRKLERLGIAFETDNDTEAACRYLQWRMREGDDLATALGHGFEALDGFFTLLMGTRTQLALVRDPFACKPAVVAEHDDYVAIASEFRSLAHLPDIKNAKVFEPSPREMYVWSI